MILLPRLKVRLDPRRSFAARLLFGLFLAFLIPGTILVFLLEGRVDELHDSSRQQFGAVMSFQSSVQLQQDTNFRAARIERRAGVAEEAAWSLASAAELALKQPVTVREAAIRKDKHGHAWSEKPENDSVGFLRPDAVSDPKARADYVRLRTVVPLMNQLLARRRLIKSVGIWTASGAVRFVPWLEIHEAIRQSGGELEHFVFNRSTGFPPQAPPTGERPVWTAGWGGPRMDAESRTATLFVPIRDAQGELVGAVSMDVDAQRYVSKSLKPGGLLGDLWLAIDSGGRVLAITPRMANLLRWNGVASEALGDSSDKERRRLAERILAAPTSLGEYVLSGR